MTRRRWITSFDRLGRWKGIDPATVFQLVNGLMPCLGESPILSKRRHKRDRVRCAHWTRPEKHRTMWNHHRARHGRRFA